MDTQAQIEQARSGILPEGVALAVTGSDKGGEQALYREGDEIVCYWQRYEGEALVRTVTRRSPLTADMARKLCASYLARNNA